MNNETKTCPHCSEKIWVSAKVCPRCRQWLTLRSLSHPAYQLWFSALPAILLLSAICIFGIKKMERVMYPRPFYTEAPDSVRVTESKMEFRQTENGIRLYIVGLVTNKSQIPWKDAEFECRFYDINKTLVDVAHPGASMTIQSNDDAAFSLMIKPSRRTNDYSSFTLRVVTARSGLGY